MILVVRCRVLGVAEEGFLRSTSHHAKLDRRVSIQVSPAPYQILGRVFGNLRVKSLKGLVIREATMHYNNLLGHPAKCQFIGIERRGETPFAMVS